MNFYKSRYTGAQIDSLLDKVKEDLVSSATLTNKVGANTTAIEQEVTDREKAVSDLNSALTAELDKKVSKVPGKGLSTNDYTNDDKAEVTKIKDKADQTDLNETNSNIRDINTAIEKLVPKEDINTGEFDPTSDNPAGQKSIAGAMAKFANEVVENKANVDGNYPTMTVGNADNANNLITTKGLTVNDDPMSFGVVGGAQKSAVGDGNATLNKLVCVDVVKNQLVQNGNFGDTSRWYGSGATFSISNNVATFTATELYGGLQHGIQLQTHKYLLGCSLKSSVATDKIRLLMTDGQRNYSVPAQSNTNEQSLFVLADVSNASSGYIKIQDNRTSDWTSVDVKNVILIDLTQRYGSNDVVNAIIGSDTSTQVAKLLAFDPEILNDTDYDKGTLVPSKTAKLLSVGVNQWDEETELGIIDENGNLISSNTNIRSKNYTRVSPSANYYAKITTTGNVLIVFYDRNHIFIGIKSIFKVYADSVNQNNVFTTPSNCAYFKLSFENTYGATYNHDICINVSDSNINGKYYPYKANPVVLPNYEGHGILKVVDGKVVADGTELYPDGNSKKKLNTLTITSSMVQAVSQTYENVVYYGIAKPIDAIFYGKFYTGVKPITIVGFDYKIGDYGSATKIYAFDPSADIYILWFGFPVGTTLEQAKSALDGKVMIYRLATEEDITTPEFQSIFPVEQGGTLQFLDENDNPIAGLQGNEIFYQKNIKAFVEAFGESIDWNPEIANDLRTTKTRVSAVERAVGLLEEESLNLSEVLDIIDAGLAKNYFKAGDQFHVNWKENDTTSHNIDHDVVDLEDVVVLENGEEVTKHALTLQWHFSMTDVPFDTDEFMAKTKATMPAGTYHFKVQHDSWGGNNGKTYQFTATSDIPAGSFLKPTNAHNESMAGKNMNVYADWGDSTATTSYAISEGSDGVDLGTMSSKTEQGQASAYLEACEEKGGIYLNDYQAVVYGDNNYYYSYVRQYLNATTTGFFTQQHIFDRPPSDWSTKRGFLAGYDDEFISAIKLTKRVVSSNTLVYGGANYTMYDKIFLPTMANMNVDGFSTVQNTGGIEGNAYEYYKGLAVGQSNLNPNGTFKAYGTYAILKKYNYKNKSSAVYYWTSSTLRSSASGLLRVYSSGAVDDSLSAMGRIAVSPAFNLIK